MPSFGLDRVALERLLADTLGKQLVVAGVAPLGESSRATPWRIEAEHGGETVSYLLRYGESVSRNEVVALLAMSSHPIPTPAVVYWDEGGEALGTTVFISELIDGEPLLPPMTRGEQWAIDLYIETACALQAVQAEELTPGAADQLAGNESIAEVVDAAYARLDEPTTLHEQAYRRLRDTVPAVPPPAFSNGDLWPENMLVRDRQLVGVIDWQHAGWTDPIFEFLLPFFLVPELRGKGIEERFCFAKGYDPAVLDWYHGVEFFDSLSAVLKTGKPYEMHTAESLTADLERWLSE